MVYAWVEDAENKKLIQYAEDNKENIIADGFNDINFSELNKYVSVYSDNGDIIVLDNGNKCLDDNVFDYVLRSSSPAIIN